MKIRNGFVSNSSSSSFILINREGDLSQINIPKSLIKGPKHWKEITLPCKEGTYEFGWDFRIYGDLLDKLNFTTILLIDEHTSSDFWNRKKVFEDAVEEVLNIHVQYDYNSVLYGDPATIDAGIDHQTMEDSHNYEMFKDKESMKAFLFNPESAIYGGNDNSDSPNWYMEAYRKAYGEEDYQYRFGDYDEDQ